MFFLFESDRLGFRETAPRDAVAMFELNADPEVLKFTGDEPFTSVEEAHDFLSKYQDFKKHGMGRWAVVDKETNNVLGWCGLKKHKENFVDLGFRLKKEYWGRGIATEASLACIKYGFEHLGLKEIVARSVPQNAASLKVMEKCGFVFSGLEEDELHGEEIKVYKITYEDFSRY